MAEVNEVQRNIGVDSKCWSAFGDGHSSNGWKFLKSLLELRFKTVTLLDKDSWTLTSVIAIMWQILENWIFLSN